MKTDNNSRVNDIEFMLNWLETIIKFYIEIGESGYDTVLDSFYKLQKTGNKQAVNENFNEINVDTIEDLSQQNLSELNRRLKERFGKTLYDFQKNSDKKIAQIIKRRKIRNEDEFRLAQMHIDRIFQDTEKEEEWKILEDLCFEFEQSVESVEN